ncbi:MAG: AAA family ATPase [Candidatus Verstraetearchaeota archaeon]|nr:AAA family ATPase [Candidatus Verstraetearchaeota archaeon]
MGAIKAFEKGNPERLAGIARRFIEACRNAELDLVAITDHNSIDGYRHLKPHFDELAQEARDQGLPMPVVLPGVEFSVGGERPIHFLVVFATDTDPEEIDRAISYVFGARYRFDPKTGTPRATGHSVDEFLRRLYDYCHPTSGDRRLDFIVLPAHVDGRQGLIQETAGSIAATPAEISVAPSLWDEMKGHLRQWVVTRHDWHGFQTARPFDQLPQAFKELLWQWAVARRGQDWEQLTEDQKRRYRELKHWPLVECSDPHNYETLGSRYTWLKMEVPDVEGIRLALLDPESRLRRMADAPPGQNYSWIERIRIRNTDFFESIKIPFSPCLSTLIGGRGSGKSTVVEYLRFVLDRARREDFSGEAGNETWESVQKFLKGKEQRDFGETYGTLLPDYEIEVEVVVAEQRYRVLRTADGIRVFQEREGEWQEVSLDVRTLITPRVFSQRQIAHIAQIPAAQRVELDALLDATKAREIEEEINEVKAELTQLQQMRKRLKTAQEKLLSYETELRKIGHRIAYIEQKGGSKILQQLHACEQEQNWLEEILQILERRAEALDKHAADVESEISGLSDIPINDSIDTWLESVPRRVEEALVTLAESLRREAKRLRELASAIESELDAQWRPRYEQVQKAYGAIREELETRGIDLEQYERLVEQRGYLEREIRSLQGIKDKLEEVDNDVHKLRKKLIDLRKKKLELRLDLANKLEETDADVRIEIIPFGDRGDFESRREEWFPRAGLQERDWIPLVDYVFSETGSVPDRIAKLVAALRADLEATQTRGRVITSNESEVVALLGELGERLTRHFFHIFEHPDRIKLDEMEAFLPEDAVEARVRSRDGSFKPISTGSVGERSMAILSLLLSAGNEPLIIDQPEDDLDNQYIYDVVVALLRKCKFNRQIIVATHNANIPVNGDAELIVALGVENRLGTLLGVGSIDRPEIKDLVSQIMEGSAEAFRLRRERYGY